MMILGIDPGLTGGLAFLEAAESPALYPMPRLGAAVDGEAVAKLIEKHRPELAVLEQVHAMPKQGVASSFKFGRVVGLLEGVIQALRVPLIAVSPGRWQRALHVGVEGSLDPKARSLVAARRLYPNVNLLATERSRKEHPGLVDALLLATWGRDHQVLGKRGAA